MTSKVKRHKKSSSLTTYIDLSVFERQLRREKERRQRAEELARKKMYLEIINALMMGCKTHTVEGIKMITVTYPADYIKDVNEKIARENQDARQKGLQDQVGEYKFKKQGNLAEGAILTWLTLNRSIPRQCWCFSEEHGADKIDFWLVRDGDTVLTIDIKSAYWSNLADVDLQVNIGVTSDIPELKAEMANRNVDIDRRLGNKKSDIYVLAQVLSDKNAVNILGYAWYHELQDAANDGQITTQDKHGNEVNPFVYISLNKKRYHHLHTLDEMRTLFAKKLGINNLTLEAEN